MAAGPSGFFEPVFFLLGIGLGVGALVGDVSYGGELVPYKEFVAPAMLAASAMNGAVYESTINVFAKPQMDDGTTESSPRRSASVTSRSAS